MVYYHIYIYSVTRNWINLFSINFIYHTYQFIYPAFGTTGLLVYPGSVFFSAEKTEFNLKLKWLMLLLLYLSAQTIISIICFPIGYNRLKKYIINKACKNENIRQNDEIAILFRAIFRKCFEYFCPCLKINCINLEYRNCIDSIILIE